MPALTLPLEAEAGVKDHTPPSLGTGAFCAPELPRASVLRVPDFFFDFCLSASTHFWTTSTDEVAWPQGDQFLGRHVAQCHFSLQPNDFRFRLTPRKAPGG